MTDFRACDNCGQDERAHFQVQIAGSEEGMFLGICPKGVYSNVQQVQALLSEASEKNPPVKDPS